MVTSSPLFLSFSFFSLAILSLCRSPTSLSLAPNSASLTLQPLTNYKQGLMYMTLLLFLAANHSTKAVAYLACNNFTCAYPSLLLGNNFFSAVHILAYYPGLHSAEEDGENISGELYSSLIRGRTAILGVVILPDTKRKVIEKIWREGLPKLLWPPEAVSPFLDHSTGRLYSP
ncbi:hypothetical protein DVH24_017967 [Malus domestica]|uniref:Uncharacterized protein n=1 Tax=Malus domestica TaxID=3750 RepID=A0A498KJI6_MALDO|nr:hypothetical protein DVH24_017967 [Malus domestica]